MGTIEEIRRMQDQGVSEQEIQKSLVSQGISEAEAREALTQSKIKEAVMNPSMDVSSEQNQQEMQPSMLEHEGSASTSQASISQASYTNARNAQEQAPQEYQYPSYEPYTGNISSDVINEIAEQIIVEKLSPLKEKIERALDFKNIIDTKVEYIDERLKRIEHTIDRLQLSILQKVGDYMTNVEDIKHELQETQKSFKALIPELQNPQSSSHRQEKRTSSSPSVP